MPARILVVDDESSLERLMLQRFRKQVRNKVFEFSFALNGVQALEILEQDELYDVILCDINMPEMDGITLLSKLNELDLKLRTVMVSAYGDMQNIRATMNLGAYDFVTKPIDFEDLEVTINKTLKEVEILRQAAMAKELKEKNEYLSRLDHLKTRLFTNISHELRTPLTIISGMTEQIQEHPDKWLSKGLQMIKWNSFNLLNLANQILDLRKLEMGKIELHVIHSDIIQFLKYIFESFQSLAEQKDIQLQFSSDQDQIMMDYDPEKILRIVSNLLSNAIKFTEAGGQIDLKIQGQNAGEKPNKKLNNGMLKLSVIDTGVGIPPKQLPHVFNRFYQVEEDSLSNSEERQLSTKIGTGIGLTIVKEFVQLLEGEIKVESKIGEGTTFSLVLPVRREAKSKIEDPETLIHQFPLFNSDPTSGREKELLVPAKNIDSLHQLLIVEDNPDVSQYLRACLEDRYQLYFAQDGKEGIDKAIEIVPDIIISDVMMPVKSGYELVATLKSDQRTSHIPIILLTAKADDDAKLSGLEKGADAYLTKPFNRRELTIRLQKLIELRQQLQERFRRAEDAVPGVDPESEFIKRVKEEITKNIDDEYFGINELCKAIGMSRAQLHRKIKALTGRSTSIFIRSIRLHKAKTLLLHSDLNISQVAFEVGFSDPKYFSKTFNEEFGQTPKAFRTKQSN